MGMNDRVWPAIGIDLGMSYSSVGIWQNGHVEIIPNAHGSRLTPSCVAFTNTQRLIGEAAVNQGRTNFSNTIFDVKRLIGRRFDDEVVQTNLQHWPFKVVAGRKDQHKKPLVVVSYMDEEKQFSAEEISAMILMKMKDTAETYLGKSVWNAVVTVPAYFNDSQRQATKDAGAIAGLHVLRILNEPTAAAMAYVYEKNAYDFHKMSNNGILKKNVLVFDLGGGSFDVALVCIENDKCEVKSYNGDTHLGGCDFDNRMVSHFVDEFKKKYNKDVGQSRKAIGRLRLACEKAKRVLSLLPETSIELDYLYEGIDFDSSITRERFESINDDLFQKCIERVRQCLYDARIGKSDVHEIILVGGSTRIPKIQQLLQEFFDGKELFKSINPDEVVAYGASLNAAILCGITNNKVTIPVDVIPFSLGVEDGVGNMTTVISRHTTIPTKVKYMCKVSNEREPQFLDRIFRQLLKIVTICIEKCKTEDNDDSQTSVLEIPVYEGERVKARDNNSLGIFEITGICQSKDPSQFINFWFEVDNNGILNVSAEDTRPGNKSQITVINCNKLSEAEMDRMKYEAKEYKALDEKYQQMVEAKNALEDYVNDMWEKVTDFKQDNGAKVATQNAVDWLDLNSDNVLDAAKYEEKLKELEFICRPLISMTR